MAKQRGGSRTFYITLVVLVVIAAIILGVLGGLGYFKKRGSSPLVISGSGSVQNSAVAGYGGPSELVLSNPYPIYMSGSGQDLPSAVSYSIDRVHPATCMKWEGAQCSETAYITLTYSDGTTSQSTSDITALGESEVVLNNIPAHIIGGVTRSPTKIDITAQQTKNGMLGPMSNVLSYTMPPPKH